MRVVPRKRRRGVAAVELAIAVMPLMMIMMGILEGGRLMMVEEQLGNAAREGARLAVLGGSTMGSSTSTSSTDVNYRVRQYLAPAQIINGVSVTITDLDAPTIGDLTEASAGDRIQVAVSVPFQQVAWCSPWFFGQATLASSCIMRKEAP